MGEISQEDSLEQIEHQGLFTAGLRRGALGKSLSRSGQRCRRMVFGEPKNVSKRKGGLAVLGVS